MSKNALQKILVTLGVLVVLYGIVRLASGGGEDVRPGAAELAAVLDGLDERSIQVVRMIGPDQEIEISRAPDGWRVNGFATDSAAVARMFSALEEAEVGSMVAANPANHERLEVAGHEAWTIEFGLGGDVTRQLVLGSVGSVFQTVYARLPDADEVYTIRGDLRGALTRTITDWRNKIVVRVDTARVHTLVVERDGQSETVERADSAWTLASSGGAADTDNVTALLRELRDLRATAFPDDGTEFPTEDVRRLVAMSESGDTLTVVELVQDGSDYLTRVRGTEQLFRVPSFRAIRVVPEMQQLAPAQG